MKGYFLFEDDAGTLRVLRTQKPIFIASVQPYYELKGKLHSKAFFIGKERYRLVVDQVFLSASDSKIAWALNRAISSVQAAKSNE